MIIDCISDLHGCYPELEGGDLLIIAGDIISQGDNIVEFQEWEKDWLRFESKKYKKTIIVPGNHDEVCKYIACGEISWNWYSDVSFLCDSGTEFQGLKIWGSPWTKTFMRMNPRCKSFTVDTEEQLCDKWNMIPYDTDILITHCPPFGILDVAKNYYFGVEKEENVGSIGLRNMVISGGSMPNLKLHVFGHIHECGGRRLFTTLGKFVNASYMHEEYEPVNEPVRVFL